MQAENFSVSKSSRTKLFTTRIALTFSCMELLRLSYFLNTDLKSGITFFIIRNNPNIKNGIIPTKIQESFFPTRIEAVTAKISISGLRTAIRMIIIKATCTLVTSVVRRETSEAVEILSMLAKENCCTFSKRFAAQIFRKARRRNSAVVAGKNAK